MPGVAHTRSSLMLLTAGGLLFGLDRWTKALVAEALPLHSSRSVVDGFFDLVHARNTGIAFSIFHDASPFIRELLLPILSAVAVVVILALFWKQGKAASRIRWALALILAGAAGNLYDRLAYGYVVDFLDFYVGSWHWPAFNVADSCITVGAALLILDSLTAPAAASGEQPETA